MEKNEMQHVPESGHFKWCILNGVYVCFFVHMVYTAKLH